MNKSPRFKLNSVDLAKIGRGTLVTAVGAAIAFVGGIYLDVDYVVSMNGSSYDLSAFATVVIGALLEAGRRWVSSNEAH